MIFISAGRDARCVLERGSSAGRGAELPDARVRDAARFRNVAKGSNTGRA